ncbi:MAG: peptidylprolyl isomerase [Bacteroidales bacterium]|nr:peptidylprolyl isomerase [Bacteroidales bacterium]MDE6802232.1 peptidylprolyl isomerase [Muribaculaceae bacterium]
MTTENNDIIVDIQTTKGTVKVKLYGDTPGHRDNFVKLAREGVYEGTLFHRVIKDFMVQAGDPDSKTAKPGQMLGSGDLGYTQPAEFVYPKHFHKKGALAAARTGDQVNPERRSSASQFYIVTGKVYNDSTLKQMERQMQMQKVQEAFYALQDQYRSKIMELRRNKDQAGLDALRDQLVKEAEQTAASAPVFTEEQRQAYTTVGGTPHLDGQYTVFGEVIEGMDIIDELQKVATDRNDRPNEDIKILKVTVEA